MSRFTALTSGELAMLWAIVLLELVSPIPAALTFGAIYVLAVRPPAFLDLVQRLYGQGGDPPGRSGTPAS